MDVEDKHVKTVTTTEFYMFKKVEENKSMLVRDKREIKKTEIKCGEMKTTTSEIKNMLEDQILQEKRLVNLKTSIETIQNKTQRVKIL